MNRLDHDEASLHIDADAGLLYDLVCDVTRTPEWSPEVISCAWLGGADHAAVGARFTARNRRRWFTWSNRPVVETADRARQFAITRTEPGGGTIRWSYRLEPDAAGTTVTLSYDALRPVPAGLHLMLRLLFGVRDLRADLHQNMATSLARLAEVARREAAGQVPQAPGRINHGGRAGSGRARRGTPVPEAPAADGLPLTLRFAVHAISRGWV